MMGTAGLQGSLIASPTKWIFPLGIPERMGSLTHPKYSINTASNYFLHCKENIAIFIQ